jgi:predicted AAA+ superfamily ATPase
LRRDGGKRKNLIVSGARQTGKTTILAKFAKDNYKHVVNIDFSDVFSKDRFDTWGKDEIEHKSAESFGKLFSMFDKNFIDSKDTAIFIDEIQYCPYIYNFIRDMTKVLDSHLIATGSYLKRLYDDPNVVRIAAELEELELTSLSFPEFLTAVGYREEYEEADVLGSSDSAVYELLHQLFRAYLICGGLPAVVTEYITTGVLDSIDREIEGVFTVYLDESRQYLTDIIDKVLLSNAVSAVASLMLTKQTGIAGVEILEHSLMEGRADIGIVVDGTKKDRNTSVRKVVSWLIGSHVIGGCGRAFNCKFPAFYDVFKYYFRDVGLARWVLSSLVSDSGNKLSALGENFAFLTLSRLASEKKILPATPVFATYSKTYASVFALETKFSGGETRTSEKALADGKVNYIVKAKGKGPFGVDGKVFNVPLYLLEKFNFDLGEKKVELKDTIFDLPNLNALGKQPRTSFKNIAPPDKS